MIGNTNAGQSVNNSLITLKQGSNVKGTFYLNQEGNQTITLDEGTQYTKLTGTIATSEWESSGGGSILDGQNLANWDDCTWIGTNLKEKQFNSSLGLVVGQTYTLTCTIDGTQKTATATAQDGSSQGMSGAVIAIFTDSDSYTINIFDNVDFGAQEVAENKCYVYGSPTTVIGTLTGQGIGGGGYTKTITNSNIKTNSAVDMRVNTAESFTATKTDGSMTLTASSQPSSAIDYQIEILQTSVEGALNVINSYQKEVYTQTETKNLIGNNMFFTTSSTSPATIYGGTWTELGTLSIGSSTVHCWQRS